MSLAELEPVKEKTLPKIEAVIERKFEVFSYDVPDDLPVLSTAHVEQVFLESENDEDYRIAQESIYDEFAVYEILNVSGDTTKRRGISQQDYYSLYANHNYPKIEFYRFNSCFDEQTLSIDSYFIDTPDELIIVSVHFTDSQNQTARQNAKDFVAPDWIDMEVTGDPSYYGTGLIPSNSALRTKC